MSTILSNEEINHLRISSLLLKIGPRAVRKVFNQNFPPGGLQTVLNMEKLTLEKLQKKRVINQAQWNLLYDQSRTGPISSEDFDLTLMACLLRNLTKMKIQDMLPSTSDESVGADVSRIKYYRNQIAHSDDGKISQKEFDQIWENVSKAIIRIGGEEFAQECTDLKVASLNNHDKEILLAIRNNARELEKLSELVHDLQDPVPLNIKEIHKLKIDLWKAENNKFIETRAGTFIFDAIQEHNIVTVIGNPGTGKSSLIHNVALKLHECKSYDILPVSYPVDIVNYNNPERSQVFVIDDMCGKYSISGHLLESWEILKEDIETILRSHDTKILLSCRTNIFRSLYFQRAKWLREKVCDICSPNLSLTKEESDKIACVYLSPDEVSNITDLVHLKYDFFPLLCKLYPENRQHDIKDFFARPVKAMEDNLKNLQTQTDRTPFCSLALLVMFNNKLEDEWFVSVMSDYENSTLQLLYEECEMTNIPPRKSLKRQLDLLIGSYVSFSENEYKALHDKIFDILAYYFGRELFDFMLQHADNNFISERYQFETVTEFRSETTIPVPSNKETDYFHRIIQNIDVAFDNKQLVYPTYRTKFIAYCQEHKDKIIPHLLKIDETQSQPPIVRVVSCGYEDLVEMLLGFGAPINVRDNLGRSLVNIAIENDFSNILTMVLQSNADPNIPDKQGFTPLCVAAGMGKAHFCEMLLVHRADPDKCSFASMFPLYWATLNGFPDVVSVLLASNANPNLQNSNGWTPLYVACRNGSYEIANLLLQAGADPNLLPTQFSVSPIYETISRGHIEIVKLLIQHHADFKQMLKGHYCLNEAVERNYTAITQLLLENGSDPNLPDADEKFPLLIAASTGNYELITMLLGFGANINKCSKNLHTPLSVASYFGRFESVKYLLENKADPNYVNENEETALHIAVRSTNPQVVDILLTYKSDPNARNIHGNSCLSEAAFYGHEKTVQILLQKKADPNSANNFGESPLLRASRAGHLKTVEILLDNSADPNICDSDGNSPLSEATYNGHYSVVLLLLENNAFPNLSNIGGITALHKAVTVTRKDLVELLLNFNARSDICDLSGTSPKDIAIMDNQQEIIQTFLYFDNTL